MWLYVKHTSNCAGLELQRFELRSPVWTGERLRLPFADGRKRAVVGWTDLFGGRPCRVHVARGWGMPIIWVEDEGDLPGEVRRVIAT